MCAGVKYAVKAIQKSRVKDYDTFQNEIKILRTLVSEQSESVGPPEYNQTV